MGFSIGVSTSASLETGSGLTSLVASAGMLAHVSSVLSSSLGKGASVSAALVSGCGAWPLSGGGNYRCCTSRSAITKKKKVRFRGDGDVGSQKTSGRASAEQNHASWNVDKLRCIYRSPRLMATHMLPRDDKLVAAVAECPQNVLAGGPKENMGRPMGQANRCSLARSAAGMARYRPNVRN